MSARFILRVNFAPFTNGEVIYLVRGAPTEGSHLFVTESPSGAVLCVGRPARIALIPPSLLVPFPFPPDGPPAEISRLPCPCGCEGWIDN